MPASDSDMPKTDSTDSAAETAKSSKTTFHLHIPNPSILVRQKSMDMRLDSFTKSQRAALSTAGNLQRLVSAYHDSEVGVELLENSKISQSIDGADVFKFRRRVILYLERKDGRNLPFGQAYSIISIPKSNSEILDYYNQGAGLGQIFFKFGILPKYFLEFVGKQLYINNLSIGVKDHEIAAKPKISVGSIKRVNREDYDQRKNFNSKPDEEARDFEAQLADIIESNSNCSHDGMGEWWPKKNFWRLYQLTDKEIKCEILEVLLENLFELDI